MKVLVILSFLVAVVPAWSIPGGYPGYPFPGFPYPGFPYPDGGFPSEDLYAASLENAPVGLYDKKHVGGPFGGSGSGQSSDITSASLGGAKVGLYGKEHPQQGYPVPFPLVQPIRPVRPPRPPRY